MKQQIDSLAIILCILFAGIAKSGDLDEVFVDGFESEVVINVPLGAISRELNIPGLGSYTYYLYIPLDYDGISLNPVVIAWHGAAGPGNATNAAIAVRDDWSGIAEQGDFIVLAQVATGAQGGWIPNNAEAIVDLLLSDLESEYLINRQRLYGWGFSAGGHVMHELFLRRSDEFAAYSVNAGVLEAFAGTNAPAIASRNIPVNIIVGDDDPLQPFALADRQRFINAGWINGQNLQYSEFNGGHLYFLSHLTTHWNFMRTRTSP